ncbi:hypothetical protein ACFO0N_21600 [Halobium salinum]|uniref:Uncharacterized protein n=1 Tax=Halobium salinum TaxID=1364940 RepID=A0ABD5PI12_9EURY|nr:hypothetical protein [Halobium salinum]
MSELTEFDSNASEKTDTDFYLPAAAISPDLDRIDEIVGNLFDFHGVVLIPDTYNK